MLCSRSAANGEQGAQDQVPARHRERHRRQPEQVRDDQPLRRHRHPRLSGGPRSPAVTLSLALLIVYSLLMVALGQWIGRRVRGGADFFVAGRGLSAGLIFSTFLAANVGAGSTVGATAIGYDDGLSAWWRNGSAGLGSLALAFWIAPRIWREASAHGDLTVGDFLERHYGGAMRGLVGVLIWCGTLSILAAQLLGIAAVLFVVAGIPLVMGCAAGALVTIGYFVSGGLLSSA